MKPVSTRLVVAVALPVVIIVMGNEGAFHVLRFRFLFRFDLLHHRFYLPGIAARLHHKIVPFGAHQFGQQQIVAFVDPGPAAGGNAETGVSGAAAVDRHHESRGTTFEVAGIALSRPSEIITAATSPLVPSNSPAAPDVVVVQSVSLVSAVLSAHR